MSLPALRGVIYLGTVLCSITLIAIRWSGFQVLSHATFVGSTAFSPSLLLLLVKLNTVT